MRAGRAEVDGAAVAPAGTLKNTDAAPAAARTPRNLDRRINDTSSVTVALAVGLQELADAIEPGLELVLGLGVREPDEASAGGAERGARQHGHAGLGEQPVGELVLVHAGAGDVRKGVERALRFGTANAGDRVQAIDDEVSTVLEDSDHAMHRVLGLLGRERLDRGHLREGGGT